MQVVTWRKSSQSVEGTSSQCVELAALSGGVGVRDSKAPEAGHLTFDRRDFRALLAELKRQA
ncbi:DUF397 domain-containing protein [Actinomadura luteofluorescens]|uniref:DUF397 domain-containing protein n=1 Tax=Actinomadura luteofluorescens TaxID=46163 RepID=A0A7Y9EL49_9ACTN|nr:DUF397 domain-containing protein [Actinomadura luteofluorescens]NYD49774.1 hypothetical protein [Actinomadura luteofluorescens]